MVRGIGVSAGGVGLGVGFGAISAGAVAMCAWLSGEGLVPLGLLTTEYFSSNSRGRMVSTDVGRPCGSEPRTLRCLVNPRFNLLGAEDNFALAA